MQLAGAGIFTRALRLFQLDARGVQLFLELGLARNLVLFRLPARCQFSGLLLQIGKVALQCGEPVAGWLVGFLAQRLPLNLQLHDTAVEIFDFLRFALHLHADAGRGLVHQIDRLVGQEAIGDVAVGQRRGGHDRAVRDADAVMRFIFVLDAAQDGDGVLHRRLADEDGLEPPLERGVLLDIFAIFVERRRADAVEFAAREGGFQQVACINRAFGFACADQSMHLVNKEDDLALSRLHLVEHALQPLLEFAAIFSARDQRAHIERHQGAVFQRIRHVAIGDAQRQTFGDGSLANARVANQDGIVLGPASKDLDGAADFLVAADDGIQLAVPRRLRKVASEFLERVIAILGACRVGGAALAQLVDRGVQPVGLDPGGSQRLARRRRGGEGEREQQPFNGNETVARLLRHLLGAVEHAHRIIVEAGRLLRATARHGGHLGERGIGVAQRDLRRSACRLDKARRHALLILQQRL